MLFSQFTVQYVYCLWFCTQFLLQYNNSSHMKQQVLEYD